MIKATRYRVTERVDVTVDLSGVPDMKASYGTYIFAPDLLAITYRGDDWTSGRWTASGPQRLKSGGTGRNRCDAEGWNLTAGPDWVQKIIDHFRPGGHSEVTSDDIEVA